MSLSAVDSIGLRRRFCHVPNAWLRQRKNEIRKTGKVQRMTRSFEAHWGKVQNPVYSCRCKEAMRGESCRQTVLVIVAWSVYKLPKIEVIGCPCSFMSCKLSHRCSPEIRTTVDKCIGRINAWPSGENAGCRSEGEA